MDADRFDQFLRVIASGGTRRNLLTGLAGGWLAALPLATSLERADARKRKGKKRKKRRSCSNKANGTDCGGGKSCQGGKCVCAPSSRICGGTCCPPGNVCLNPETEECVDAQGTCASGANYCVDGSDDARCGASDECFCHQTFAGETRCGTQIVNSGQCTCTSDDVCITEFGPGAFCARDAGGGFCAACSATGNGFCAVRCAT